MEVLIMAMNINPNNMSSSAEVKTYKHFKDLKGHVDKAVDKLKNIDNDDKVDLSPAKGNVAIENFKVFDTNVRATGALTYDPQSGEVKKLDLDTKDTAEYMATSDTVKTHISYADDGNTQVYDFQKHDHVHDHLSELTDNTKFHWKYTVDKKTGVITAEENLPYDSK